MKVLVVKLSSMGDLVHTLPALTDAARALPAVEFDWVAEEAFVDIPALHSQVRRVIPFGLRRWRRRPFASVGEVRVFRQDLRRDTYDLVIDAQGLLKSAIVTSRARAQASHGLDRRSAREPVAARFYDHCHAVARDQHAIDRVRQLFAAALGYEVGADAPDYGIGTAAQRAADRPRIVFLHGTSRADKCWPVPCWQALAEHAFAEGVEILLPRGARREVERAHAIAGGDPRAHVIERAPLVDVIGLLAGAAAVVSVDTGLGHVTAALGRPCVALYGPTDPRLIGTRGPNQQHVDMAVATPASVWQDVRGMLAE